MKEHFEIKQEELASKSKEELQLLLEEQKEDFNHFLAFAQIDICEEIMKNIKNINESLSEAC